MDVLVNEVAYVGTPYKAVEGANHVYFQPGSLFEQSHDLSAVFADYVAVIPSCLVEIIMLEIHLVGKERTVYRAECAEGVGGEQYSVG